MEPKHSLQNAIETEYMTISNVQIELSLDGVSYKKYCSIVYCFIMTVVGRGWARARRRVRLRRTRCGAEVAWPPLYPPQLWSQHRLRLLNRQLCPLHLLSIATTVKVLDAIPPAIQVNVFDKSRNMLRFLLTSKFL